MKLASLLVQYLNTNKRLPLRGIGLFQSTPSQNINPDNSKHRFPAEDISFQNDPNTSDDEDFIKFISAQTGKMRALAVSDLESYLELAQQFLNIGKPFQIDGIGTLVKIKQGYYEFTSGIQMNEKITEVPGKEPLSETYGFGSYRKYPKHTSAGFTFKKVFIAFLLFGGIGLAVWGGYALYNKNRTVGAADPIPEKAIVPVEDTTISTAQKKQPVADTIKKAISTIVTMPGYKFVFETTPNKKRAIKRYAFLKNINSDIHLETIDSTLFNITVSLNIPSSDTTRVKDSLNTWYYGKKDMLVKIASHNTTSNVP